MQWTSTLKLQIPPRRNRRVSQNITRVYRHSMAPTGSHVTCRSKETTHSGWLYYPGRGPSGDQPIQSSSQPLLLSKPFYLPTGEMAEYRGDDGRCT